MVRVVQLVGGISITLVAMFALLVATSPRHVPHRDDPNGDSGNDAENLYST